MNYPTNTWQELNWYPAYSGNDFFNFCSNVTNANAPADVTAIDAILASYTNGESWRNLGNYATYFKNNLLPFCPSGDYDSPNCFGTQNGMSAFALHNFADKHPASYRADTHNRGGRSYLYTSLYYLPTAVFY